MHRRLRFIAYAITLAALIGPPTLAAGILLEPTGPYSLQSRGFSLDRPAEARIEAVGLRRSNSWNLWPWRDEDEFLVYAWLLDADSREPVWTMDPYATDRESSGRNLRRADATIDLQPGRYELYLFAGIPEWMVQESDDDQGDSRGTKKGGLLDWLSGREGGRRLVEESEACHVELTVTGVRDSELETWDVDGDLPGALVQLNRLGNSELATSGLEITSPTNVRIYGIAEQLDSSEQAADYGWIVDQRTHERVWDMTRSMQQDAGGSDKNRLVDEELRLEPGRYVLYYGTDDSHSFERFNTNPPRDPFNWGVTLLPGRDFEATAFATFDVAELPPPLIDHTRVGDSDVFEQPFRMEREGSIRVRALGEYVGDENFADRAWIVRAGSGKVAWEMTGRNTWGAGGAEKNRMFDGLVRLGAGDYVLYYVSDSSHSFEEFNQATPFEPSAWGVAIYPGTDGNLVDLTLLDPSMIGDDPDILASLIRIGNDERRRQRFTVDAQTRVRIQAVGEGRSGSMYDYGYIVDDATGRQVWEMDWQHSEHAGGAEKNRQVSEEIVLPPGTYEAIFVSDDSHSFAGWNDVSPRNPLSWGMTIRRLAES